jgi:F5/8 type C domain
MAAHRYWRISITAAAAANYAMSEIQFRTAAGTPRAFSGGTPSASTILDNAYAATFATDGASLTFWVSLDKATFPVAWWAYDYGAGNAADIREIAITARSDGGWETQTPTQFTPQWSDNGTTWTDMLAVTAAAWTSGQTQTFTVSPPDPNAHRYWRLYATTSGSVLFALSELQFRAVPGGANILTGGTPVTGGDYDPAVNPPSFLLDSDITTWWGSSLSLPGWWGYDLGVGHSADVVEVLLAARNGSNFDQSPIAFSIDWSNDGSAWTTQQSFIASPWTTAGQIQTFGVTPPPPPPAAAGLFFT